MAEALAIEGAKWAASTIVTGLLKEGFSYLSIDISTKLQELETTILPQFQFVIEAAERSSVHKNTFQSWLRELKDAIYEAEDVLDLYKYQLLKEKVSHLNTHPALKPFKRVARKVNAKLCILSPHKIKLRISLNKLEKIAAKAKTFFELLQIRIGNDGQNLRNEGQPKGTSSFPLHDVFGREKELDEIIKYLLDPSEASKPEKNYSVGAIVAIGGAGKTTLAQLVYRDTRVVNHFDIKMWVCISRKLDLAKHTKDMIESSGKSGHLNVESSLEAIQSKLAELVNSKKILLVLDDVWFGRSTGSTEEEWQTLVAPLAKSVKSGSKVLVTTRTTTLPVALRGYNMELNDLEENHILSLFKLHAFGGNKLDDSHLEKELMTIGKQIVQNLHRSPLAAKAVGCQLRKTLEVKAWKAALQQNNLRDSQQALLWSYQRLDAPLQRCFSYCSLFPKGHRYDADELIYPWMAEGFVNSSKDDHRRIEDIAMGYFNELVSGSFLLHAENNEEYYMHDLFHDLAENISKEDCLRIEDDQVREIPQTIRHLSILGRDKRENSISLNKLENLRTLIIEDDSLSSDATADLLAATEKYKSLRVLMIYDVSRETSTKLLPNLKHLRFLSFQLNEEGEIPAAVGKLYHLQVLNLPYNASLPRSLKNLINLRHYFPEDDEALASLPDIGRLTSLETLPRFVVKKEKGHDIGQLNNLNELRGSLTISNLENVEGKDRVVEANIKAKSHLEQLHLEWDKDDDVESDYRRDLDMEVLEGLQPHPNLTKLTIEGYKSPRYPSWLLREECLQNLRKLTFDNCAALEVLPPISNLFPNCSKLKILRLSKLRELPSLPQSLKKLVIRDCPSLILVSEDEVQKSDDDRKKSIMTTMRSYQLINRKLNAKEIASDCLEVKRLLESEKVNVPEDFTTLATTLQSHERMDDLNLWEAYCHIQEQRLEAIFGRREKNELILPSSLQTLELDHCNITDGALSQSLQGLTCLESLTLYNISAITTLPAEEVLHHLIALTKLKINVCHWLKSLRGLYALPSLEVLWINNSPCLELEMVTPLLLLLPGEDGGGRCILPPSLRLLRMWEITTMKSFVVTAGDLPNLTQLRLVDCPSLGSLSLSHLTALTWLDIWTCPKLERLYLDSCPGISSLQEILPKSLKELKLWNCLGISSLPEKLPESLEQIEILNCPVLELRCRTPSLVSLSLSHLIALTSLGMASCRELEILHLDSCSSISSLPEDLPESLKELKLWNCPSILSLPQKLPESLGQIEILNCPVLEVRCRSPNGEDWPKIAHIPRRIISRSKMHACLKLLCFG